MKRVYHLSILLFIILINCSNIKAQQKFDLPCTSNSTQPYQPLITRNPITDNFKANACVDNTGTVFFQGNINVFNALSYGLKGDGAESSNCSITGVGGGPWTVTCTDGQFLSSMVVGQAIGCGSSFLNYLTGVSASIPATISSITDNTHAITGPANGVISSPQVCAWGSLNDSKIVPYELAIKNAAKGDNGNGTVQLPYTGSPVEYFPAGTYLFCNHSVGIQNDGAGNPNGYKIMGDTGGGSPMFPATKIIFLPGCNAGGATYFFTANTADVVDISVDGILGNFSTPGGAAVNIQNGRRVKVSRFGGVSGILAANNIHFDRVIVNQGSTTGGGFVCNQCSGEINNWFFSNNAGGPNLQVINTAGPPNTAQLIFRGGFNDESGSTGTAHGGADIEGANDVTFIDSVLTSNNNGGIAWALTVDANSYVRLIGGAVAPFGNQLNENGAFVNGTLEATGTRFIASGVAKSININGSGVFRDNGGNSTETTFPITSGTSTGTVAVITVSITAGVAPNVACQLGDAVYITGAAIQTYDGYHVAGITSGITALSGTTIQFSTQGSNLGALGAGGNIFCRNLISYTGNLPIPLLNNPVPNTCYLTITPIVNATTYQLCNWGAGTHTNITRITASSQNITACATPPIITISNGTVSQTLTLTTAKQSWDSFNAQDASTGVGTTIFKPSISLTGTDRITVKYDAGALSACATPPTQLAVSYTVAPILSN